MLIIICKNPIYQLFALFLLVITNINAEQFEFSYDFVPTDGKPWTNSRIEGVVVVERDLLDPTGDTFNIHGFKYVRLVRQGLDDYSYGVNIGSDFINSLAMDGTSNVSGYVARMSITGNNNNFRVCPNGFTWPVENPYDCPYSGDGAGGFGWTTDANENIDVSAADGLFTEECGYDAELNPDGSLRGCRVSNGRPGTPPGNLSGWSFVRLDPDGDGDTNPDARGSLDNCPQLPNPLQTDTDSDGEGDLCDICPNDATNQCSVTEIPMTFSYTYVGTHRGAGKVLMGQVIGIPLADPNIVAIKSFGTVSLDGVEYASIDNSEVRTFFSGHTPLASFDGSILDFWVCPVIADQMNNDGFDCNFAFNSGFSIHSYTYLGSVSFAGDGTGGASRGVDIPIDTTNWSLAEIVNDDIDGDGILNDAPDNCPLTANFGQSDIDGDGTGDVCDICPADAIDSCELGGAAAVEVVAIDGATIATDDEAITLVISPGALSTDTTISATQDDIDPNIVVGTDLGAAQPVASYTFGPEGTVFANPITLTLVFDVSSLSEIQRAALTIYLLEGDTYVVVPGSECSIENDTATCTAPLTHFSTYSALTNFETGLDYCEDDNGDGVDAFGCFNSFVGLENLLSILVDEDSVDEKMLNSLTDKVNAAESFFLSGDRTCDVIDKLRALKSQIGAQTDKKISISAGLQLTNYVNYLTSDLLASLPEEESCSST